MRPAMIALNLVVATASVGLLAYTFLARDHLVGVAEDFVVGKTVGYANPLVDQAEAAVDAVLKEPRVAAIVPPGSREAARAEIAAYRKDPDGYVRDLVARGVAVERPQHPLADAVLGWKAKVRDYFEGTLAGLIRDLRIFSGTNVVGGVLAAWLASRARGRWRYHVLAASGLLLFSLLFNAYMFVDGLTFFRVLFDTRMGWSYPLIVALTFGLLYMRVGVHVPLTPREPDRAGGPPPQDVR